MTLQFRLLDRFGDHGLIGALILRPDPRQPDVLEVETWVMIGRRRGARAFHASYVPTKKNGVIRDLYPKLGFSRANAETSVDGAVHWSLTLAEYVGRETHIDRLEK